MSFEELRTLIAHGEGDRLELQGEASRDVASHVAAFASTSGGVVMVGVDDGGAIVGVDAVEDVASQLRRWIEGYVHPAPVFEIGRLTLDGSDILVVLAPRGREPVYFCRNTAYQRRGPASCKMAAPEIIRRLRG